LQKLFEHKIMLYAIAYYHKDDVEVSCNSTSNKNTPNI